MAGDYYIIPIFVPHEGCPHDCIFCNQREITGVEDEMTPDKVEQIITDYLSTIDSHNNRVEVAFYGGSFTGLAIPKQNRLLATAYEYIQEGRVDSLRLSTRPDYIDQEILTNLARYKVEIIELGVQSLFKQVLQASCRGHSVSDVKQAAKLIKAAGFKLGIQLMPGLPESTKESMIQSAARSVELAPDLVRIYPTLVIANTQLAKLYQQGQFEPLSLQKAVEICTEELRIFRRHQIPVIRIGLQPSEGVNQQAVVAGPFHPAFRQLVESNLILEKLKAKLGNEVVRKQLTLITNPKFSSVLRGQKNSNLEELRANYGIEMEIELDESLARGEVIIKERREKISRINN
ncbi:MAG: elongator complex protein 3 [Bacillota bacterium]